ncbi:MAG: DNA-3-methyladenine glycosylase [Acidobacteriota bacterium]
MRPLPKAFYARPTLDVARDLLGRLVVHDHPDDGTLVGRIVETEAYTENDPAFHGWGLVDRSTGRVRPEGRAYALFGEPGDAYVYLNYGIHWLLNAVTEEAGTGGAVLVRALEPVLGLDAMRRRREAARRPRDLTNGPGKLTSALGVDGRHHGGTLLETPLYLAAGEPVDDTEVEATARIGLSKGNDRDWRFIVRASEFVSPGRPGVAPKRRRGQPRTGPERRR